MTLITVQVFKNCKSDECSQCTGAQDTQWQNVLGCPGGTPGQERAPDGTPERVKAPDGTLRQEMQQFYKQWYSNKLWTLLEHWAHLKAFLKILLIWKQKRNQIILIKGWQHRGQEPHSLTRLFFVVLSEPQQKAQTWWNARKQNARKHITSGFTKLLSPRVHEAFSAAKLTLR